MLKVVVWWELNRVPRRTFRLMQKFPDLDSLLHGESFGYFAGNVRVEVWLLQRIHCIQLRMGNLLVISIVFHFLLMLIYWLALRFPNIPQLIGWLYIFEFLLSLRVLLWLSPSTINALRVFTVFAKGGFIEIPFIMIVEFGFELLLAFFDKAAHRVLLCRFLSNINCYAWQIVQMFATQSNRRYLCRCALRITASQQ